MIWLIKGIQQGDQWWHQDDFLCPNLVGDAGLSSPQLYNGQSQKSILIFSYKSKLILGWILFDSDTEATSKIPLYTEGFYQRHHFFRRMTTPACGSRPSWCRRCSPRWSPSGPSSQVTNRMWRVNVYVFLEQVWWKAQAVIFNSMGLLLALVWSIQLVSVSISIRIPINKSRWELSMRRQSLSQWPSARVECSEVLALLILWSMKRLDEFHLLMRST